MPAREPELDDSTGSDPVAPKATAGATIPAASVKLKPPVLAAVLLLVVVKAAEVTVLSEPQVKPAPTAAAAVDESVELAGTALVTVKPASAAGLLVSADTVLEVELSPKWNLNPEVPVLVGTVCSTVVLGASASEASVDVGAVAVLDAEATIAAATLLGEPNEIAAAYGAHTGPNGKEVVVAGASAGSPAAGASTSVCGRLDAVSSKRSADENSGVDTAFAETAGGATTATSSSSSDVGSAPVNVSNTSSTMSACAAVVGATDNKCACAPTIVAYSNLNGFCPKLTEMRVPGLQSPMANTNLVRAPKNPSGCIPQRQSHITSATRQKTFVHCKVHARCSELQSTR